MLTSFALSFRRNWSARAGELHSVRGLQFYCWRCVEQSDIAVTQLYVPVGNELEKDAEAALPGFVDSEIPSDQILFPSVQECRSRPGFCAILTKPESNGWVAVIVPEVW